ncbi:hypothetical protein BCR35DRAFT_280062 [Leucosporidium creatinivorum]|uniref:Glycosyltransferase family 25 protein n=1 Tax=Leucosporidium creatinivorum TaxID=106004 RepID=A0A1Y2F3R7_9BASI|nr:hypothetical protein BCR35DRAFT_280062 [Leucosporidium creatinivorum]
MLFLRQLLSSSSSTSPSSPTRPAWPYLAALGAGLFLLLLISHHPPTTALQTLRNHPAYLSASSHLSSLLPSSPEDPLAYRKYLEATTSPTAQITHHPTLGFSKIYVLSLPNRTDRREEMNKLARALGVEVTFVDAADKGEGFIKWIAERVGESRQLRASVMAKARHTSPSSIGGLAIGTDWLSPTLDLGTPTSPGHIPFPPFPSNSSYTGGNWVTHLEALHSEGRHTTLKPSDPAFNVTKALHDPRERKEVRQLHEGIISTWWGQSRVVKQMLEDGCESALVLEDDVDVEWEVERIWSRIRRRLPKDWGVVMLGHCWSHEILSPWYLHPLLHPSVSPMCLHGWALSTLGARRLQAHLQNPWHAFSTAVDLVLPSLLYHHELPPYSTFSIQPPLIIQRKDGPSDLQKGSGSKWRGVLGDSTVERLKRDEGVWKGEEEVGEVWHEEGGVDPATAFREERHCAD